MNSVLVVESDVATRGALNDLLTLEWPHLVVITADNGTKGLQLAYETHPDLILLEKDLPGIDGCQMAKLLRQTPETKSIPLIAITSNPRDSHLATDNLCDTCNAHLLKPFSATRLLQTVASFVKQATLANQSNRQNRHIS